MLHYFVLQLLNLEIPLVYLLSHLLDTAPSFVLVPLQGLDLLVGYLKLLFFKADDFGHSVAFLLALLDLIFFGQDHGGYPLVYLAQKGVKRQILRVHLRYLLQSVQIRQH